MFLKASILCNRKRSFYNLNLLICARDMYIRNELYIRKTSLAQAFLILFSVVTVSHVESSVVPVVP